MPEGFSQAPSHFLLEGCCAVLPPKKELAGRLGGVSELTGLFRTYLSFGADTSLFPGAPSHGPST